MLTYIILGLVGLLESFLSTVNSKFRQKNKKTAAFITSFINILIWYYVISKVMENIANVKLALVYAMTYASGDVIGLIFDEYLDRLAKLAGFKLKKKVIRKRVK